MQKATQKNNIISIATPLGTDTLYLTSFSANEGISQLFSFTASMYAVGTKVELEGLVGKAVCISLRNAESSGTIRYFHGIISHLQSNGSRTAAAGESEDYIDYQAVIVPTVNFMQKRSNCRIYQNLSVIDIVSELFAEHGVEFKNLTTNSYDKYEYCVQYQESDLAFVCRLLQQAGIFFYFEHNESSHTLILADDVFSYSKCAEAQVQCFSGSLAESHVSAWQGGLSMVNGSFQQKGYDFQQPKTLPSGKNNKSSLPKQSAYEVYDYVGESEINKRAQVYADNQLEALQKDMHQCSGQGDCRSFTVGKYFTFSEHQDSRYKGKSFLITHLRTTATQPNQSGANMASSEQVFANHFQCVPKDIPYRASVVAQKPLINGVQTAVVTGDAGDEQHIDQFGRVKVQFHWDREGQNDSKSSCWIRVAQNWAGNKWGAFFFPRVGQEVLVEFINGDPDQPMISGALYNADLMPPYELPAKKTQSGIKTRSTKGGAADNFNELRFEDEKGKELLFLQAEKDHELNIKNDQKDTVGNDRLTNVVNNDTASIGNDRANDIGNNDTVNVGNVFQLEAGSKIVLKTGGASITLNSSGAIDIKGTNISVNGTDVSVKGAKIALKAASIALN